jgi:integrase
MYTEGQKRAKIGVVTVDIHGKSYRIRFSYPKETRHQFAIANVSPEGWSTALRAAQLINRDIDLGDFDNTYARYSPRHARQLALATAESKKEYDLKELWEAYKEQGKNRVAKTTQGNLWKLLDKIIRDCENKYLKLNSATEFIGYLQKHYALSTIKTLVRTCIDPCVNLGLRNKLISENPYDFAALPKVQKPSISAFEPDEVKEIIAAFYSNKYNPKSSRYEHSFYAPMVEFLALTGCRPEECHALTWDDIKTRGDKTFIRINKAYSKGILLPHTKTHTIRLFPCNEQLKQLLARVPKRVNENNLVFPSSGGAYVNQDNFRGRYWNRILKGLVEEGLIEQRLKPYCLRHSFITRLIRDGVDIATVASLSGNSPEIIIQRYLASRKDFDLPEL